MLRNTLRASQAEGEPQTRQGNPKKDITADVQRIKEFLRQNIGTTYATATQPSDANLLGVDMTDII